jgi:hypothetical protein
MIHMGLQGALFSKTTLLNDQLTDDYPLHLADGTYITRALLKTTSLTIS